MISKSSGKRGRPTTHYVCSGRKTRPGCGCQFERGVPEAVLGDEVLAALREEFLDAEVLQDLVHQTITRWQSAPDEHEAERRARTARLATLDSELGRLST